MLDNLVVETQQSVKNLKHAVAEVTVAPKTKTVSMAHAHLYSDLFNEWKLKINQVYKHLEAFLLKKSTI